MPTHPSWQNSLECGSLTVKLRPLRSTDVSGILNLEHTLVNEGMGSALGPNDLPQSETEMRHSLSFWLRGPMDRTLLTNGLYLVIAAPPSSGTVPILASGEIRRLTATKVRHVALLALGVHPNFRRYGLASAIMRGLLDWAWSQAIMRVELYVRADNLPAINLYRKFDFQEEGRRRQVIQVNKHSFVDDIIMSKLRTVEGV